MCGLNLQCNYALNVPNFDLTEDWQIGQQVENSVTSEMPTLLKFVLTFFSLVARRGLTDWATSGELGYISKVRASKIGIDFFFH